MKLLRPVGAACVLALVLAGPASAGHIHTGVAGSRQAPSPPPAVMAEEKNEGGAAGHIETGAAASDSLAGTALSIIGGMLALF